MIDNYIEKTYAGWLGKVIGVRLGSPIENWTYEEIIRIYGNKDIKNYLVDYNVYAADDDTNGPLFFIRALKDYKYDDSITEKEMGLTWLNYAAELHGFFWWGGFGVSTEHTAYLNLKHGIHAPKSGSIEQNGRTCAEQIGGQIFIDSWGYVNPGNPKKAAEYAKKIASVSHDGEALHGAMFVAACNSAAYIRKNINDTIQDGLSVIPEDCEYSKVVKNVMNFYQKEKDDWHKCYQYIFNNYGYDKYKGVCHIIPNSAIMILSMLYGNNDFSLTQSIINRCGWDTDCNAGNVGSILGILVGLEGIEDKWIRPINDLMLASSVIGNLNISTLSQNVSLFCQIGYNIAGEEAPEPWKNIFEKENLYFHFELPKSKQAFLAKSIDESNDAEITLNNSNEESYSGSRSLKIIANKFLNKKRLKVYHKTYYRANDLHDARYKPVFSPCVYPGQIIKGIIKHDGAMHVNVQLYAEDVNNNTNYISENTELTTKWNAIEFRIPAIEGGLIGEIGLLFTTKADNHNRKFVAFLDSLEVVGGVDYSIDFTRERLEVFSGVNRHVEVSQFTYYSGFWELDGEYYSGSCTDRGESYTGNYSLKDYALECTINPQIGKHHAINVRVQGGVRSYAVALIDNNTIAIYKNNNGYSLLSSTSFKWKYNKDVTITIKVIKNIITIYDENECEILSYIDTHNSYNYGAYGFSVLEGSHCHYKHLKIKSIA